MSVTIVIVQYQIMLQSSSCFDARLKIMLKRHHCSGPLVTMILTILSTTISQPREKHFDVNRNKFKSKLYLGTTFEQIYDLNTYLG